VKRSAGRADARLAALAGEWSLDSRTVARLAVLLELLRDDPRAATAVTDPAEAVDAHVADSLTALPWLPVSGRIADIGSGAGFPGLPLALARPELHVGLVESARRKCDFLAAAVARLELHDVAVVNARAEDWARGEGAGRHDAVLARAVAPLATLVEYAAPLLAPGGRLIAWKGAHAAQEEEAGARPAAVVGMAPAGAHRVSPYPGSRSHTLYLYEKVRDTPPQFPRRAGAARKHPLA
jgi:16S rRNA (guanine527-N7)-methyltransferase